MFGDIRKSIWALFSRSSFMKRTIRQFRKELIDSMVEYLQNDDATYTQADVDSCISIVDEFLGQLSKVPKRNKNEFILKVVKTVVLKLNELNEECDGGLIETYQRDQLGGLINTAAKEAGLTTEGDDITEEWREW
jgi:hypothetical protein